jgi:hypothetical protein
VCRLSSNKWNGEKDEAKVVVEEGEKDVVAEMVSGCSQKHNSHVLFHVSLTLVRYLYQCF